MADHGENVIPGMLITDGCYLKPSKRARVLAILDALSRDSTVSQFELGRQLHLSGAMVNQYLKQLQSEQLIEFYPVNGKSYNYTLTEQGKASRQRMFSDYSSETVRLYSTIKEFVLNRLGFLEKQGKTKLVLFGASETCEVVLSALRETGFQILALLDNDTKKQGQIFNGHVVSAPHVLDQVDCDAVVITSFGKQAEIFEQLEPYSEKRGFQIVRF
ncbi:winged helix-turn-helix transcriptional regulator [Pseudodesulfovibrio sp. JC047]|uniref:winged helix-turn-helix transcriptional regulator n=1 Tax=Pseudodesulfovibrio sp. JC047 TaxID=2683199 RepID=UPI0013D38AF1|nr:winged helix-turn-helix transcriptional regulator [Pseudodesulfovibrio sp. JC047]NDV20337.1 winged helix-turn-helix transcriptional regulator [Pseudodesulfovibrio sp. JC047]